MAPPLLLYDADCGFCLRAAAWARVAGLNVAIRPLQSVNLAALGVNAERAVRELPLVTGDGDVYYGHRAVAGALRTGPAAARIAGSIMAHPCVAPLARTTYTWVSRHRHLLRRGPAACARPTAHKQAMHAEQEHAG